MFRIELPGSFYRYLETLKNAIAVNGGVGRRALSDPTIELLAASFASEYSTLGIDFLTLLPQLNEAASRMRVTVVNMKGGILDYRRHEDDGLHVIAIGGLALSRGLTLEGLSVSYILRNAGASDTLMQMARWFGIPARLRRHLPPVPSWPIPRPLRGHHRSDRGAQE